MPTKKYKRKGSLPTIPTATATYSEGTTSTTNTVSGMGGKRSREYTEGEETRRRVPARKKGVIEPRWAWSSLVSDVLSQSLKKHSEEDINLGEMRLKEFLRYYLDEDLPDGVKNVPMNTVVNNPDRYVPEELREAIYSLHSFQQLRDVHQAMEDISILHGRSITTLQQWKENGDKNITDISAYGKGILSAAVTEAEQTVNSRHQRYRGKVLEGVYESIYNAKWYHVVKTPKSSASNLWLEVKEGSPSLEFTNGEMDYLSHSLNNAASIGDQEEDNENELPPKEESVQMMVLISDKEWPYGIQNNRKIPDCFVTRETERVWRIIMDDLGKPGDERRQRVLIGTPGIGKSMAAGSYILYKLLHCDTQLLSKVAYFISEKAYIFDKEEKQVKVYGEKNGVDIIGQYAINSKGFTIYDCSGRNGEPPPGLPINWGTIVITSPNEKHYKGWGNQRTSLDIIINCPSESDIKAMCAWKKSTQLGELQEYWKDIKDRMSHVGPILRFIFDSDEVYEKRLEAVNTTVNRITPSNVVEYYGVNSNGLWSTPQVSHQIVKITRRIHNVTETFYNEPICDLVREKILDAIYTAETYNAQALSSLYPDREISAVILEKYSLRAFMCENFINMICKKLTELRPENGRRIRKCVLETNSKQYPNDRIYIPEKNAIIEKVTLEYMKLYIPSCKQFPVLDGFFFVQQPLRTIVGIQVTTAKEHHTTPSKVSELRKYLYAFFNDADKIVTKFRWEIIYVQHEDGESMTVFQRCVPPKDQQDKENSVYNEIIKHWDEKVYQYQVGISNKNLIDIVKKKVSQE